MTTMDGLGIALAIGGIALVPLALRLVAGNPPPSMLRIARTTALPTGALVGFSLTQPVGFFATALAVPWVLLGLASIYLAAVTAKDCGLKLRPDVRHAEAAALAFFGVATVAALLDRSGVTPLGLDPLTIRLTAIHFTVAAFVLPIVGVDLWRLRPSRWLELALGLLIVGIPVTALGFVGIGGASWPGSLAVSLGGFGIGIAAVLRARLLATMTARVLLAVAGFSILISMPLALAFASAGFLRIAWLDIPTMARIHGTLNVLGFGVSSVAALVIQQRLVRQEATASRFVNTSLRTSSRGLR